MTTQSSGAQPQSSFSTAAASGGAALAFVVVMQWLLAKVGISIPADVAGAIATLMTTGFHYLALNHFIPAQGIRSDGATVCPTAAAAEASPGE